MGAASSPVASALGQLVICRNTTGARWTYWTGFGIGRRRQRWTPQVKGACRFHLEGHALEMAARLDAGDAIVVSVDAVVDDE